MSDPNRVARNPNPPHHAPTPPMCPYKRPIDPGYGCELYEGHDGQHEALSGEVKWTVGVLISKPKHRSRP